MNVGCLPRIVVDDAAACPDGQRCVPERDVVSVDSVADFDVGGQVEVDATREESEVGVDAAADHQEGDREAELACTPPYRLCGQACVDVRSDLGNCGLCGAVCAQHANAVPRCAEGSCQQLCDVGFSDCNNRAEDGCEVDTRADFMHCGGCGRSCVNGQACLGGTCTSRQMSCRGSVTPPGCGIVAIPGGTLTLGDSAALGASPLQPGVVVAGFELDQYPVTVARFRRFVDAGMPAVPGGGVTYRTGNGTVMVPWLGQVQNEKTLRCDNWTRQDREDHPVTCMSWYTAQAFCVWDGGRLPTEAEWELAARTTDGRAWPWGNEQDWSRVCASVGGTSRTSTCRVDDPAFSAGRSRDQVWHMVGNVWEWVADNYGEYSASDDVGPCRNRSMLSNPLCINSIPYHTVRGASWDDSMAAYLRSSSRALRPSAVAGYNTGLRCARGN